MKKQGQLFFTPLKGKQIFTIMFFEIIVLTMILPYKVLFKMYSQIFLFTSIIRNSNCYDHFKYWNLSLPFFTQGLKWLKTKIFDLDELNLIHIEVRI